MSPRQGFVVSAFTGDEGMTFTIPADETREGFYIPAGSSSCSLYEFPQSDTTRESHRAMLNEIIAEIEAGRLKKCIAARAIVCNGEVDIEATFRELDKALPSAFVFCFHSPLSGTWMGATPETLLQVIGPNVFSASLAGTRPAGTEGDWDEKNLREQEIVTGFIRDVMSRYVVKVITKGPMTRHAGPVDHLHTFIGGRLKEFSASSVASLAKELSPTPAVSGLPRGKAIGIIERREDFDRAYYGGFCGPVSGKGGGMFFVNLRSMWIERDRYCLYAGGGIVEDSQADAEWEETERKAATLREHIILKTKP